MRVCHFVTNPYVYDTRVRKQCESLVQLGCEVVVVAMAHRDLPPVETINGVKVIRIEVPPRMFRGLLRPVIATLRARTGRSRLWNAYDAMSAFGRALGLRIGASLPWRAVRWGCRQGVRACRLALRVVRGVAARLKAIVRPPAQPVDIAAMLDEARQHEARFTRGQHVKYWLSSVMVVVLLPALVVLGVPAAVLMFVLRSLIWAIRGAWAKLRALLQPLRRHVHHFKRCATMIDQGARVDANVYQANDYDTLAAAYMCARMRGVKFIYDIHELYDESFPTRKPFRTRYWIRLWEGFFGRRAVRSMTVGENIARVVADRYGIPRPLVVYNAQVYLGPVPPSDHIRHKIDDPVRTRTVFIYAGRITRGRGLLECVAAMSHLPREAAALVLMGNADPTFLAELREAVAARRLEDRVYLLDPVPSDDLPAVLQGADVGLMLTNAVCLSYYYGLGNKMFHYINAGIPVLASNHPEKAGFVNGHSVGVCVDQITPAEIGRAMMQLVREPQRVEAMKARCREVAPNVSWQQEEGKYVGVYTDVYEDLLFNIAEPVA